LWFHVLFFYPFTPPLLLFSLTFFQSSSLYFLLFTFPLSVLKSFFYPSKGSDLSLLSNISIFLYPSAHRVFLLQIRVSLWHRTHLCSPDLHRLNEI
jgi:hypothetical protein